MSMYMICFSPTGGTEKVAEILSQKIDVEVQMIDLCDPKLPNHTFTRGYCLDRRPILWWTGSRTGSSTS